jgi:hypothetical protein
MAVSNDPTPLHTVLQQIASASAPAGTKPVAAANPAPQAEGARQAQAEPRVKVPADAKALDPNAPRGTHLNLVV